MGAEFFSVWVDPAQYKGQYARRTLELIDSVKQQVVRHRETWTREGRPEVTQDEGCVALYLCEERSGNRVHNQIAPGADLLIPERFQIQDEVFMMPFWKEFELSRAYLGAVLKNIVGLVPLGFVFYAWFSEKATRRSAAWITTILGVMVSITIEILQAYLPTRDSGTTDVFTNTLGTWLGVLAYRYTERRGLRWDVFGWTSRETEKD